MLSQPSIPNVVYYSSDYGQNFTQSVNTCRTNILRAKQPIIANDDFSYVTICGGYAQGNVSSGVFEYVTPCTYYKSFNRIRINIIL